MVSISYTALRGFRDFMKLLDPFFSKFMKKLEILGNS